MQGWHFPESNHTCGLFVFWLLPCPHCDLWVCAQWKTPPHSLCCCTVLGDLAVWLGNRNETFRAQGFLQGQGSPFWGRTSPPSAFDLRQILGRTACIHPLHPFIHSSPVSPHLSRFYFHLLDFWYFSPLLLMNFCFEARTHSFQTVVLFLVLLNTGNHCILLWSNILVMTKHSHAISYTVQRAMLLLY